MTQLEQDFVSRDNTETTTLQITKLQQDVVSRDNTETTLRQQL